MAELSRSIAVFVNTTHQRNWCSRGRLMLYFLPMWAEHSGVFLFSDCVIARRECATLRALGFSRTVLNCGRIFTPERLSEVPCPDTLHVCVTWRGVSPRVIMLLAC
jgi:hypothetical protein